MNYIEFTVLKAFTSQFIRPCQSLQWNVCATHVNNFSSNLVERVDFSGYCGLVYKFFQINNIELKCSFVRCRKYHKSWSNGAAEPHISVGFTLWQNSCRATQLGKFTLWHNGRRATQLGKFALWYNGRRTKPGLMHAPGVADIFQRQDGPCAWKMWRLNPK